MELEGGGVASAIFAVLLEERERESMLGDVSFIKPAEKRPRVVGLIGSELGRGQASRNSIKSSASESSESKSASPRIEAWYPFEAARLSLSGRIVGVGAMVPKRPWDHPMSDASGVWGREPKCTEERESEEEGDMEGVDWEE